MRWVFIFLVFLNIFFYIWQSQQVTLTPTDDQNTTDYSDVSSATIKLFKEQPIAEHTLIASENSNNQQISSTAESADGDIVSTDNTETITEPLTCLYLGGFTNKEQLEVIDPFLVEVSNNISPTAIKLSKTPQFQLYIIVNNSIQQQALLEKLTNATINTLIIARGPLKDNISLGLFSDGATYREIQDKLKALEISIQTENLPESASSYWLKISNDKRPLFSHRVLDKFIQQLPSMQQELMPCHLTTD